MEWGEHPRAALAFLMLGFSHLQDTGDNLSLGLLLFKLFLKL